MTVNTRLKQWWKEAVVYQIYPASFCDSNGDGIGDLPGITSKLDYIADLGVDMIWICPMYESPQIDMGYDISNYEDIHRPYGTMQDMETLIQETHARGMKVMLDLVINHTSDQHAWFKESRSSKDNPKRDWYIWRPAKYNEKGERMPPNNWRSNFGNISAWTWDEHTGEYYLHVFAREQPDLNWDNETARKAIYKSAMEFWLERGVDGFRVDTVNMYNKPAAMPDAPIIDPKTYYQPARDVYCNGPRMFEYLGEMNAILTKYGAITVGECPDTPVPTIIQYVSAAAKRLDMVFQMDVLHLGWGVTHRYDTAPRNYTLPGLKQAVGFTQDLIRGTDAWTSVFLENHDQPRSVSRFTDDSPQYRVAGAKLLALMQACLSGTQYIFQGQEIGAVNAPKDSYPLANYIDLDAVSYVDHIKELYGPDDKEAMERAFDSLQYLARDHGRIPMAWDGTNKYGGFTDPALAAGREISQPWMVPHPLAGDINVASQLDDSSSVLAYWRRMLRFRREHADLLVYGDYKTLQEDNVDTYMFLKETVGGTGDKALVVMNFTKQEKSWVPPSAAELGLPEGGAVSFVPLASTHDLKATGEVLAAFEGRVYLVKASELPN